MKSVECSANVKLVPLHTVSSRSNQLTRSEAFSRWLAGKTSISAWKTFADSSRPSYNAGKSIHEGSFCSAYTPQGTQNLTLSRNSTTISSQLPKLLTVLTDPPGLVLGSVLFSIGFLFSRYDKGLKQGNEIPHMLVKPCIRILCDINKKFQIINVDINTTVSRFGERKYCQSNVNEIWLNAIPRL